MTCEKFKILNAMVRASLKLNYWKHTFLCDEMSTKRRMNRLKVAEDFPELKIGAWERSRWPFLRRKWPIVADANWARLKATSKASMIQPKSYQRLDASFSPIICKNNTNRPYTVLPKWGVQATSMSGLLVLCLNIMG